MRDFFYPTGSTTNTHPLHLSEDVQLIFAGTAKLPGEEIRGEIKILPQLV